MADVRVTYRVGETSTESLVLHEVGSWGVDHNGWLRISSTEGATLALFPAAAVLVARAV